MDSDATQSNDDSWSSGNPYDRFMGRWSSLAAREFLAWLEFPPPKRWLDVGCGTGVLTRLILQDYQPWSVLGIDASPGFIKFAREAITAPEARFQVGLAESLEVESNAMDAAVSGLVLNFVPQPEAAIAEMIRVTRPGGIVGIFVWDYAEGMQMLRAFWDTAVIVDENAGEFDEDARFPICREGELEALARRSSLRDVEAVAIDVATEFKDFDDYWQPFLSKVGPAPAYLASLSPDVQQAIEAELRQSLPVNEDGSITLKARAWAVKGKA